MSEILTRKVGPFTGAVWLAILGGGLAAGLILRSRAAAGADPTPTVEAGGYGTGLDNTAPGVGNLGAVYAPASNPTAAQPNGWAAPAPTTNDEWQMLAGRALLGYGYQGTVVQDALSRYLSGATLSAAQRAIVDVAIRVAGPTPLAPPAGLPGIASYEPTGPATGSAGYSTTPGWAVTPPVTAPAKNAQLVPYRAPSVTPVKKPPTRVTYTVRKGDTLSAIGARYGIPWRTIYANNRAVIGSNPNLIRAGQNLYIKG